MGRNALTATGAVLSGVVGSTVVRRLAHRTGVTDEEFSRSIRHPWQGHAVDPHDEAALAAREAELRQGGVYLDFSWAFALGALDASRTRLVLRARGNLAPSWLRLAEVAIGPRTSTRAWACCAASAGA